MQRGPIRILTILLVCLALSACGGGGGGGGDPVVVFQVTAINPVDQQSGVALSADVILFFSGPVDPATVDSASVRIVAESGEVIAGRLSVPSAVGTNQVRFRPTIGYVPFAMHRVEVIAALKDTSGRPLDRDYRFEFQAQEQGPTLPAQRQIVDLGDLLRRGRWFHRMSLFGANQFLIAGGYTGSGTVTDVAENLLVLSQASFEITGRLNQARAAHVQVRLESGKILLAGGEQSDFDPFLPLDSCEVFDPATQLFTAVASMNFPRTFAAGVLLNDGRVLVTGGRSVDGAGAFLVRRDAEIYDPVNNSWTLLTASMSVPRAGHFSALAPDGKVVLVGGEEGIASGELYDTITRTFGPAASAPSAPHVFGAGTILPDGRPILFGGLDSRGVTLYEPDLGFIGALNLLPNPSAFATATPFPDGRVLVVGGFDVGGSLIRETADIFVPISGTGKLFRVPDFKLPNPTSHHAAALDADGNIWVTGGLPTAFFLPGLAQVYFIKPE